MLRARIADARYWRDLMATIQILIDEGPFKVEPEQIRLRAMDPSHIAMVEFSLRREAFEEYACEKPVKMCVSLSEMLKVLRGARGGTPIDITFNEEAGKLTLALKGAYAKTFSLSTLKPPEEEAPEPRFTFNARVRLLTSCFKEAVADAAIVSDRAKFHATTEGFTLTASGDLGSVTINFEMGSEALCGLEVKEASTAIFGVSYLSDMVKAASPLSEIVSIEFSTNMPVKLDFEIPRGKLVYYLAPRIEATS